MELIILNNKNLQLCENYLFLGGGVLLILSFLTATANAKSIPVISISPSIPNDLSDRLAADKDFQEFSFLIYEFTGKTQATKSGKLLLNYFEQKNSSEETNTLLTNLGYSSQNDFNAFWKKIYRLKSAFQTNFSELASMGNAKETLEVAAQKVAVEKEFSKKAKLPAAVCWTLLAAELGICSIYVCNAQGLDNCGCPWELCMGVCTAAAITYSGICFLFAE